MNYYRSNQNKKRYVLCLIFVIFIIAIISFVVYAKTNKKEATLTPSFTKEFSDINLNTLWVGSFQLAWNELKEQIGSDILINEFDSTIIDELNNEYFKKEMLSENDFYINVSKTSIEQKEKIINDLKDKGLYATDLLNGIDFSEERNSYTIYSILFKEFQFNQPFDRLNDDYFGNNSETKIKYFGIDKGTSKDVLTNAQILFFNNKNDFAVKLFTKNGEEILLFKNNENNSFQRLYSTLIEETEKYEGRKEFKRGDQLKIPLIEIDTTISYDDLCGKIINQEAGTYIKNAIQNVKFNLNEKGGHLFSEALIKEIAQGEYEDALDFDFSSQFYLFMKEENKEYPYMALKIDNIDILVDSTDE